MKDNYNIAKSKTTRQSGAKGFSLIELLISLIIISLITCAFLPILTKKIKHKEIVMASKSVSTDCSKLDDENRCLMCDSTTCSLCITQMSIPEGYYVEPNISCDYKKCVDKFFGCKTCNKDFCVECLEGYGYINEDKSCVKCSSNCLNCSSATVCTKCQAGYTLQKGACKKITDAPCLTAGKICIAKFNAGDSGGLPPVGISVLGTVKDYHCNLNNHSAKYCWQGTTSTNCNAANGGYSGCNRTACTWSAAQTICEAHGWRLPTMGELAGFINYTSNWGTNGLQLCSPQGSGAAKCSSTMNCPGSAYGDCFTYGLWSSTKGSLYYWYPNWATLSYPESQGASVRCVRDL